MPHARFDTAHLDGSGSLTVSGPIHFSSEEQTTTMVTSLSFVVVQGDVFAHGVGTVSGSGAWGGVAKVADKLKQEPAQAFGVAMLVRRAQPATAATPKKAPVVETLTWSEAVTITS